MCIFFFRVSRIISNGGGFGLVATNSISQGRSREVSLEEILKSGLKISMARTNVPWSGDAGVVVHLVSISGGDKNQPVLNGIEVDEISEFLLSSDEVNYTPRRLSSNKNLCFQGTNIHGTGFLIDAEKGFRITKTQPKLQFSFETLFKR